MREIFDKVKAHLLTQNAKATLPGSSACAYRGEGGLKCAVGCLISDEEYTSEMECQSVDQLILVGYLKELAPYKGMLSHLQVIHDTMPIDTWAAELDVVERLYVQV